MARIHRCGLGIFLTFSIFILVSFVYAISNGHTMWAETFLAVFTLILVCSTLFVAYNYRGPICRCCRHYIRFYLNLNDEFEPEGIPMNPAGNQVHVWNLQPGHVWHGIPGQNVPNGAIPGHNVPNGAGNPGQNVQNGGAVPGQNVQNGGVRRHNAPNRNNQGPQ